MISMIRNPNVTASARIPSHVHHKIHHTSFKTSLSALSSHGIIQIHRALIRAYRVLRHKYCRYVRTTSLVAIRHSPVVVVWAAGQSRGYTHVSAGGVPKEGAVPTLLMEALPGQASQRKPRGRPVVLVTCHQKLVARL